MPDPASRRREERELVDRCLSGDEEAWGEFVRRVAPAGRAAAGRALEKATGAASADDLEDAVQAGLSGLVEGGFAALRRFTWGCSLATYVSVIAARAAYDLATHRGRSAAAVEADLDRLAEIVPDPSAADPSEAASVSEIAESVRRAVAGLPAAQALSARLYYLEGRPVKEIARLRRVPYNTAASDLHRARQRLREDLSV